MDDKILSVSIYLLSVGKLFHYPLQLHILLLILNSMKVFFISLSLDLKKNLLISFRTPRIL